MIGGNQFGGFPGFPDRHPLLSSYSAEAREVGFPEGSPELGFLGLGVAWWFPWRFLAFLSLA